METWHWHEKPTFAGLSYTISLGAPGWWWWWWCHCATVAAVEQARAPEPSVLDQQNPQGARFLMMTVKEIVGGEHILNFSPGQSQQQTLAGFGQTAESEHIITFWFPKPAYCVTKKPGNRSFITSLTTTLRTHTNFT